MTVANVVYFLRSGVDGPIKVGTSANVEHRIRALDVGPFPLTLIGTLAGSVDLERLIHRALATDRLRLEWFRPTDFVLGFISNAIADPAIVEAICAEAIERQQCHLQRLADGEEGTITALALAVDSIFRREGSKALQEVSGVTDDQLRKYRRGTSKMNVVVLGKLLKAWPDDFALFNLITSLPHLAASEVRANRSILEAARDALDDQLRKLTVAAA